MLNIYFCNLSTESNLINIHKSVLCPVVLPNYIVVSFVLFVLWSLYKIHEMLYLLLSTFLLNYHIIFC